MPRDVTATLDDDSQVVYKAVPDDVTPEQVTARVLQEHGKGVKKLDGGNPPSAASTVLSSVKGGVLDLARGAARATTPLAGMMPGELIADPVMRHFGMKGPTDVKNEIIEASVPQDKGGTGRQYLRAGLEGLGGGLVSGPTGILRNAVLGGISGLGSEASAKMFGEGGLQRFLGGLAAGGGAGVLSSLRSTKGKLAAEAVKDVSDADLATTKANMQGAQREGIPLTASQAMPRPSNIDTISNVLANNESGAETARLLRNQPRDAAMLAEREAGALPGTVREGQQVANNVQQGATEAIQSVKDARTSLVSPLYKNAGDLGVRAPKDLAATIDRFVNAANTSPSVAAKALALKDELLTSSVSGKPRTSAEEIKAAIDDFRGTYKNPLNPPSPTELGQLKYITQQLTDQLATKSPIIRAANTVYKWASEGVVDPLKKSVVGRMATPAGSAADKEALKGRVMSVFEQGSTPGAPTSEILTLERSLRNSGNPEAFQDAAKTWLANKVGAASKQQGGRPADSTAANLEAVFAGDVNKQQGLKDILVGLARSQGLADDALLPGMQNMIKYVSMAARRPGTVGGLNAQGVQAASESALAGKIASHSLVAPFRGTFSAINQMLSKDAYRFMDKLLTTPEGIDVLKQMGRAPQRTATQDALAVFLGTMGTEAASKPAPIMAE